MSIEPKIKYEGFGGGSLVGGGPGARAPWAPLNPARGVYSIEAWTQPASLKNEGGTKIMHIFVKIGGEKN